MNYKLEVRTDIIDPHTYLEAVLNYNELLEVLNKCGGYALFQQIYKWFGNKSKGFREIQKLRKLLLVGTEQFNNNKYIYLKSTALKYLKYKDFKGEVTEDKINRLLNRPGFRPIMNSVYSLEYLMVKEQYINTSNSLKIFHIFISNARDIFSKDRFSNIHLGKIIKDEYVEQLNTKLKILGDRNAIFIKNYDSAIDLKSSTLEFVWYDFNQETDENPVFRILRLISKFLNNIGTTGKNNLLNCCNFSLEIVTLSDERMEILQKLSNRAISSIDKKNNYYLSSNSKTKENQVISHVKEIRYQVFKDIESYIRISTKGDSEFNFVDNKVVGRLEELKEYLKGGN